MNNLEKLQKIASFRVDKIYDVKFDNGDSKHYEYETIRDLFPEYFVEIENALKDYRNFEKAYNILRESYEKVISGKTLKALEIMKKFIWVENGKLFVGVKCDIERELTKDDFDNDEEYDLLKEILK